MTRAILAGCGLAALAATPARAAGTGLADLLWPTLNFVLLIAVLFLLARKPIRTFFGDRRDAVRRDLEEAAALHKGAEEKFSRWQRRMAELEGELDEIRATARERAESERETLLRDARAAAERIRREAEDAVGRELRRARTELRDEASELAVELAAKLLSDRITPDDRSRLLDEFVERIDRPTPRAGGSS